MRISLKLDVFTVDNFIHATIGLVFVLLVAKLIPALAAVVIVAAFGTWREWTQHNTDVPVWNAHRALEAAAWGVGGLASLPFV